MRVLAVIPSRYESSRFPGKPLVDLAGTSMICRVYEGVKNSNLISEVIVATDDQRVFDEVESFGGAVMMTSSNHASGTERCIEVANSMGDFDVLINIQGDEPLVDVVQIEQLIDAFDDKSVNIATLASENISAEELTNSNRIKLIVNSSNDAMYFSRSVIPNDSKKDNTFPYLKHIGLYAFRKEALMRIASMKVCVLEKTESLEQLRWLFYGEKIRVVHTSIQTPNIDAPEDVEKVLSLLNK